MITICTHPCSRVAYEDAHAGMSAKLADALAQLGQARAQLHQANRNVEALQAELARTQQGMDFYVDLFVDKCKEVR